MSKFLLLVVCLFLCLFVSTNMAIADGGMWPVYDIANLPLDSLNSEGLTLSAQDIYNPGGISLSDAVVKLRGGTASFVSKTGLLITNHHVAFGAIQKQSSVDQNFITEGFYAETSAEEIPAIGYYALVTLDIKDVTDQFHDIIDSDKTDFERYTDIESKIKKIIAEAEKNRDVECKIVKMYGNSQFILYTHFKIKDIRIVYAPPESIGNYGADIDNWMWPRHVGDFAFVRAYVAPDGSSAEYSQDNVPYKPGKYLPISSQGVSEGDLTLMIGYPGRTHRYASSYELSHLLKEYYPLYLETSKNRLNILYNLAETDPEIKIRLSSTESGINNYYKKTKGIVRGFGRAKLLELRRNQERRIIETAAALSKSLPDFNGVMAGYDSLFSAKQKYYRKDFYLKTLPGACNSLNMAIELYKWAVEREKDDIEREMGFQERDVEKCLEDFKNAQINLVPEYDRQILYYFLDKILNLPENQRITSIDNIFKGKEIQSYGIQFVDYICAKTMVTNLDSRLKMFTMSKEDLEVANDPLLNLAIMLKPEIDAMKDRAKAFDGALERLDADAIEGYNHVTQKKLHPDANSTKRLNWGEVHGYNPADAVSYNYQTYLSGVMEKETGTEPFIVSEVLKTAFLSRDKSLYRDKGQNDIPVNFLSSNSGTNGNSGSPVINGKGEFIGVDFDTSIDGVAADYYHNPALARSIIVDSRYILYIIDEVYDLKNLVKELTIH